MKNELRSILIFFLIVVIPNCCTRESNEEAPLNIKEGVEIYRAEPNSTMDMHSVYNKK